MSEAIRAQLLDRGISWPAPIEHFQCVASTNDVVRERARQGAKGWHVAIADRQTAGRGRHGRAWVSEAGDLFLSVLVRPSDLAAETHAVLPLLAGVAVCDAVREWGLDARLKWPNDVLVGERKLGGILAEASSGSLVLEHVALGIGLNLALDPPPALRDATTSVRAEIGRTPSVPAAAVAVLASWHAAAHGLAAQGRTAIVDAWRMRAADWWGRELEVASGEAPLRGVAQGVDDSGALLLRVGSGTIRVLSGEARSVRRAEEAAREDGR